MDLSNVVIREMEYSSLVSIPTNYYEKTDVLDFKDVFLQFKIYKNNDGEDVLSIHCDGKMVLNDARTLDRVDYPFTIQLEDRLEEESEIYGHFLTNSKNTLDIMSILWENIVLEIPISYTIQEDLELTEEESNEKIDPRLTPLLELLDKEKE